MNNPVLFCLRMVAQYRMAGCKCYGHLVEEGRINEVSRVIHTVKTKGQYEQ